ncbi:hypothetical protein [Haloarcula salinisoli]|uniref:Uncharacterized protein n=1 Tax=Haloarcula salinisoli TaxID=2487746 RepID=A0A8J7YII8_9EURY|nr:hypothetical protein [Halomicroarcula salinisoli]MBX0304158.1 hypothetical protein [Halomicroarcula salinisoli]
MGLFDSIRRVVGGGDASDADDTDDDAATQPDVIDTRDLDEAALRERAAGVADEVSVLDFSLSSLEQFDDAIDAGYDEDLATSDTPGAYATDTVRFGCYLGEVLIRVYGGEWTQNPDWGVTISGPDGTTTVAVFDVAERSITSGAVFAAVADRAADEVGLDGTEPAADDPDAGTDQQADAGAAAEDEPTTTDPGEDEPPTDEPAAEASSDEPTFENLSDESTAEPADDEPAFENLGDESTVETADDGPSVAEPGDDATVETADDGPSVAEPGDDATVETADDESDGEAADTGTDVPDPASADPSLSEAAREAVERVMAEEGTDSLIEEAEPGTAADATGADATPADESADPASADPSESQTVDAPDPSESLFDDETAGTGPTVADAPSAADGPPAGSSEPADPDSADAPSDDQDDERTDGPDPTDGDGLRATYAEAAEELVSFWTEYDLDYSPDSLERLDALVSAEWDDDRFDDADFGNDASFDDRVFTSVSTELGGYFGEVLVRELDAEWSDEASTDGVVVEGADGPLAIPVFKVAGTSIKQQPVFARSYDSLLSDLDR